MGIRGESDRTVADQGGLTGEELSRTAAIGRWTHIVLLALGVAAVVGVFVLPVFLLKLGVLIGGAGCIAWVLLPRALGPERARSVALGLVVSAMTLGVSLIVGELVVRMVFADVTTTADDRSYFAQRWRATLPPPNALGYREREVTPLPRDWVYRIAVIGDSFTWGQGIAHGDRMSDRLQAMMDAADPGRLEILNFGRPGAETVDHVETLRDVVLPLLPDYVLMQWYSNDVEGRDKSGRPRAARLVPSDAASTWLREHSALYYLLNNRWGRLQGALGLVGHYQDYMFARFGDPSLPDLGVAMDALREFVALARGAGVDVGIVAFPETVLVDSVSDFPYAYLFERLSEVCREDAFECLDLREAYLAISSTDGLWASRLDHHPGPLANAVAAEAVMQAFGDHWRRAARVRAKSRRGPTRDPPRGSPPP